jgi:cysteine synthase
MPSATKNGKRWRLLETHLTDVKSDHKKINEALAKEMIRTASEVGHRPQHWYCDQLNNRNATNGYLPLGEESR